MKREFWTYLLIRALASPFSILPISWVHRLGRGIGTLCFYLLTTYRKRTLSNLALAKELAFSKQELFRVAKMSFQNLAINCLEYPKFSSKKDLSEIIRCENPEVAQKLHDQKKGIIFFCGHQANWEALFLEGTSRMEGRAIGRPIKNKRLYQWIVSIRERFGGKIIEPRHAVRDSFLALRRGQFVGIVGDQGKTDSGYSFPFFGLRAWTSTAPAFLSYRTQSPLIFAETRRVEGGYRIHYSDPIWPDLSRPMEEEITRLMNQILTLLQESIRAKPGEWLWQHKRWKQPRSHNIRSDFSYDSICIVLPPDPDWILPHLPTLKRIYEFHFLTFIVPETHRDQIESSGDEVVSYQNLEEALREDYRFKLLFNFTASKKVARHYEKLSVLKTLDLSLLEKLAAPHMPPHLQGNLSEIFKRALCRPGTLWQPYGS